MTIFLVGLTWTWSKNFSTNNNKNNNNNINNINNDYNNDDADEINLPLNF